MNACALIDVFFLHLRIRIIGAVVLGVLVRGGILVHRFVTMLVGVGSRLLPALLSNVTQEQDESGRVVENFTLFLMRLQSTSTTTSTCCYGAIIVVLCVSQAIAL